MNPFQEVFVYLTQALSSLLLVVLMLRGVLTAVRADFYNPISQFVVRCTNPLILPLRKLLPITGRIDLAAVVLALAVQMTGFALIMFLSLCAAQPADTVGLVLNWADIAGREFSLRGDYRDDCTQLGGARQWAPCGLSGIPNR